MMERTLAVIKPGAVRRGWGELWDDIEELALGDYIIADFRMVRMTRAQAEIFYAEHNGKSFFEGLIEHAISGPCVAMILEGPDVIRCWRDLIGPTNPDEGDGLRSDYGEELPDNALHGSDSPEAAEREIALLFGATATEPANEQPLQVKIKKLHPLAVVPTRAHHNDAGFDVYSIEKVTVPVGAVAKVRLGFAMEIPDGWEAQLRTRSGMGARGIVISNSPGTIDAGFRGEMIALLANHTYDTTEVAPGDRVGQLVIKQVPKVEMIEVDKLSPSDRGTKGFGSSGV